MTHPPSARPGRIRVLPRVHSPERHNERDLQIYIPPSYDTTDNRYPVIYMHDGQNLFDDALAFAGEWEVDDYLDILSHVGLEALVVGIPNLGEQRFDEYSPFPDAKHGGGEGEAYVRFIAETLKPRIDREFRTLPAREHTGILGSSMGGLISLFAFFNRPATFGFAGVMSPALWFANRQIFAYVEESPVVPGNLYLDIGTGEGSEAVRNARGMKDLLVKKGYRPEENFLYVEDPGAPHSEAAWARRLPGTLSFLLPACMGCRPDSNI